MSRSPKQPDLDAIREKLRAPIPEQFLMELASGLTEINFSYQMQRMDEVFGIAGWSRRSRLISVEKIGVNGNSKNTQWEAGAEAVITIKIPGLKRVLNQFGGSSSDNKSDAMKGAVTAATSKCFQELGIGWEIYSRKQEPKVYGKSAVAIFRQGFILGFETGSNPESCLDRASALSFATRMFEEEMRMAMTKPGNGNGQSV